MSRVVFPSKYSGETKQYVFDFTSMLPIGVTISTAACSVLVFSGADATPSALLSGAATVASPKVTQVLTAGVTGVIYVVQCAATLSNGNVMTLGGYVAILPSMP